MKYIFFLCFGMIQGGYLFAQEPIYFQQETHYRIDVRLDDQLHILQGNLDLQYINHAPEPLSFIWFHLWPNAYRDQTTAFAQQQLRIAGTGFYFAKDNQLGYIDSLHFLVNGQPARLEYDPQHPDIVRLWLPEPLKTNQSIQIQTPFRVKIPDSFSRLGHVGQSYQITQWYPKPAVYDREGRHPMPYLDMGEFYSEFGSFEVNITLPENYVVGATGSLQTPEEVAFLARKAAETEAYLDTLPLRPNEGYLYEPFPPSAQQQKTIRYTADKVHDFAWFADKRFKVQQSKVQMPGGQEVQTSTMFTTTEEQLWRKSIDYVNRAVLFYAHLVGDYPYPQATAVQSALSAGGGMEYPMITVIDLAGSARSLDEVITHEVGHNWFYGLLASNERAHAWMDEGINSFYEQRYMQTYYPPAHQLIVPNFLVDKGNLDPAEIFYLMQSRRRLDQAPDTPSGEFSSANYWLGAYEKPAKAFRWLFRYWGAEKFDRAMQSYFKAWQFRHPQPADLRSSLEQSSGEDLGWLFDGLLYSNHQVDYAIIDLKEEENNWIATLQNKGNIAAPVPISGLRGDSVVYTQWIDGFSGTYELRLPADSVDLIVIDYNKQTLDVNRKNNRLKTAGLFRKLAPFRVVSPARIENEQYTSLFWLPIPAWNAYDGIQVGLLLHNRTLPGKQLEFDVLPLYGFRSKSINGLGNIDYQWYPRRGLFQKIGLGLNYRRFHFDRQEDDIYDLQYQRLQPSLTLGWHHPAGSPFSHRFQYRLILLSTERALIGREDGFLGLGKTNFTIHEWSYQGENKNYLHPFQFRFALEQQSYQDVFARRESYLKCSLDWQSAFPYADHKSIRVRFFVGGFLQNTRRRAGAIFPGAFSLIDQAATDYRYDDFYFGRSERDGFLAQQLVQRDGGFKVPVSPAFSLGKSNNFIVALNIKADLPFAAAFPVRPYFDLGYFDNAMPTGREASFNDQLLWSGGLALELLDGRLGCYFPLLNSKNIQDRLLENGSYWKRISFRFDLYGEKPRELWERTFY